MQNKINFLKRFFEPALLQRKNSKKLLFESFFGIFWFDVIPILTIPTLIVYIEKRNLQEAFYFSVLMFAVYLFFWLIHYRIRKFDMPVKYLLQLQIEEKYRKIILLKQNTAVEKIGTGQMQSIIQSGVYNWANGVHQSIYQIPKIILNISIGIFLSYKLGSMYVLLYTISIIIVVLLSAYFRKKKLAFDDKINEIENNKNANSVRMIMSRQEIVFAGAGDVEVSKIIKQNKDQFEIEEKAGRYQFLSEFFADSFGIVLPFLAIFFLYFTVNVDTFGVAAITTFIYFSSRLSFSIWQFLYFINQFLEKYPQIKKLWDFIDQVPAIKNYETGKIFEHKIGEIVLQNVSFSYDVKDAA